MSRRTRGTGVSSGPDEQGGERVTHLGVHWYRDRYGVVSFYDDSDKRWVRWGPKVDAPPLPPSWQILGVPTRFTRARWRSPRRLIPVGLAVAAVIIAVVQVLSPSKESPAQATAKEAKQAEAFLGQCWAQDGTAAGHPKYNTKSVPCDSAQAAVKVVKVLPPHSGTLCPADTVGFELPYPGVTAPHVECLQAVHPAAG